MIDHISVGTNDLARARAFHDAVRVAHGLRRLAASDGSADYGVSGTLFSIEAPVDGRPASAGNGGGDAGAAGLRPNDDAHYDGAFTYDPDGNEIEAVTRSAP